MKECTCSNSMVTRYQKRIPGPLLDRIYQPPGHIKVPRVEYDKLADDRISETSSAIQARVETARERQRLRFEGTDRMSCSDMGRAEAIHYRPRRLA